MTVPGTGVPSPLSGRVFTFMTVVVAVQGAHLFEHVVQLMQVYLFGVPDDDALGLLGYVLQFNGTEEWLHLGYNAAYVAALYALLVPLWRVTPDVVPLWAFVTFLGASVGVETWHIAEHGVIISNVVANNGCPCPGIGDRALGVTDTVLHFFYNAIAYSGLGVAYLYAWRARRSAPAISGRGTPATPRAGTAPWRPPG
jgi:hypothetical protein